MTPWRQTFAMLADEEIVTTGGHAKQTPLWKSENFYKGVLIRMGPSGGLLYQTLFDPHLEGAHHSTILQYLHRVQARLLQRGPGQRTTVQREHTYRTAASRL